MSRHIKAVVITSALVFTRKANNHAKIIISELIVHLHYLLCTCICDSNVKPNIFCGFISRKIYDVRVKNLRRRTNRTKNPNTINKVIRKNVQIKLKGLTLHPRFELSHHKTLCNQNVCLVKFCDLIDKNLHLMQTLLRPVLPGAAPSWLGFNRFLNSFYIKDELFGPIIEAFELNSNLQLFDPL